VTEENKGIEITSYTATTTSLARLLGTAFPSGAAHHKLREQLVALTKAHLVKREQGFSYKDLCDKMVMVMHTQLTVGWAASIEPLEELEKLILPIVRELETSRGCRFAQWDS
jgi:hypothetical protein